MKHKIEIAPNLAIYIDGERVIGSKPHGLFLITTMIVSDDDLKRLADRCLEVISDHKTENNLEKPNNCEHITEDGVTCAKYPACDDCLNNPLSKVKGSERLVKGSEQTEPTISKMEQVDKPQTKCQKCNNWFYDGDYFGYMCERFLNELPCKFEPKDESQPITDCK